VTAAQERATAVLPLVERVADETLAKLARTNNASERRLLMIGVLAAFLADTLVAAQGHEQEGDVCRGG
jgi:hypothetical protein